MKTLKSSMNWIILGALTILVILPGIAIIAIKHIGLHCYPPVGHWGHNKLSRMIKWKNGIGPMPKK